MKILLLEEIVYRQKKKTFLYSIIHMHFLRFYIVLYIVLILLLVLNSIL